MHIYINDESQNFRVFGDVKYSDSQNIETNFLNPNIMGPFSYIPFMECNHAILNMKTRADGFIDINNNKYNNAKLIKYEVGDDSIDIILKKGHYSLNIKSENDRGLKLIAPVKGKMGKDIFESISTSVIVTLKKDATIVFSDTSTNCGLEIVHE